jgi:molecular chaperone DnaK (HSP70)
VDWITLIGGLFAVAAIIWALYRKDDSRGGGGVSEAADSVTSNSSIHGTLGYMTPQPIGPQFHANDWDGYTGMQSALALGLAEGVCYPVIQAGSAPPISGTQTVSTGYPDQDSINIKLYIGLDSDIEKCRLVETISIGPVPVTGVAMREIEVKFSVDTDGGITVSAQDGDGTSICVEVREQMIGAIAIGR